MIYHSERDEFYQGTKWRGVRRGERIQGRELGGGMGEGVMRKGSLVNV